MDNNDISEKEKRDAELYAKAKWHEERNARIRQKRAETVEKISKMSDEELIEYYKKIESENDEFLKELGIKREDLTAKNKKKKT